MVTEDRPLVNKSMIKEHAVMSWIYDWRGNLVLSVEALKDAKVVVDEHDLGELVDVLESLYVLGVEAQPRSVRGAVRHAGKCVWFDKVGGLRGR